MRESKQLFISLLSSWSVVADDLPYIKVPLHTVYKLTPLAYGENVTGGLRELLSFYYCFANCCRLSAGEIQYWSGVRGYLPGEARGTGKFFPIFRSLKKKFALVPVKKNTSILCASFNMYLFFQSFIGCCITSFLSVVQKSFCLRSDIRQRRSMGFLLRSIHLFCCLATVRERLSLLSELCTGHWY